MEGINACPHNMTPWSFPLYPEGDIDTVDAWCFSINNLQYEEGATKIQISLVYKFSENPANEKINKML